MRRQRDFHLFAFHQLAVRARRIRHWTCRFETRGLEVVTVGIGVIRHAPIVIRPPEYVQAQFFRLHICATHTAAAFAHGPVKVHLDAVGLKILRSAC